MLEIVLRCFRMFLIVLGGSKLIQVGYVLFGLVVSGCFIAFVFVFVVFVVQLCCFISCV